MLMEAVVKQRKRSFLPKINVRRISKHQRSLFSYSSLHARHFLSLSCSRSPFSLLPVALCSKSHHGHTSPPCLKTKHQQHFIVEVRGNQTHRRACRLATRQTERERRRTAARMFFVDVSFRFKRINFLAVVEYRRSAYDTHSLFIYVCMSVESERK